MRIDIERKALPVLTGALGAIAALTLAAPPAAAEPVIPAPPPPLPAEEAPAQAASSDAAPPAEGVPHLASPENLPPGTSDEPVDPPQGRGLGYLRDLWHAVQTQEVSGSDALLLLTQRPLDPNVAPPPGVPPGPQPPLPPEPAPEPAPAPAP